MPVCSPGDCPMTNPPLPGADSTESPSCGSQEAPTSQPMGGSRRSNSDSGAGQGEAGGALGSCSGAGGLGTIRRSITVLVTPPFELWWPHEFGAQAMYHLTVTYKPGNATDEGQGGVGAAGQGDGDTLAGRESSLERCELTRA